MSASQDTYRKHTRPRALDEARPAVLQRLLARIPAGMTAHAISEKTGIALEAHDLWCLREGILDKWSDNRLLSLAERMGVKFALTFH